MRVVLAFIGLIAVYLWANKMRFFLALRALISMYVWAIFSIVAPTIRGLYDTGSDVFGWDKCYPINNDYTGCTYEHLESQLISYSIFAVILLAAYFGFDLDNFWEWFSPGFRIRSVTRQGHLKDMTAETSSLKTSTAPVTPPRKSPPPSLPTYIPQPPQFKNFHATGDSFKSRVRYNPMRDKPFRCPEAWKGRETFLDVEQESKNGFVFESIPDGPIGEKRWTYKASSSAKSTSSPTVVPEPEEASRAVKTIPEPAEKVVVDTTSINVAELPTKSTPALAPTHITPIVVPSARAEPVLTRVIVPSITVSAPAPTPAPTSTPSQGTVTIQAPTQTTNLAPLDKVVYQPAPPTAFDVLLYFAAKEGALGSEMRIFLNADFAGYEWLIPAQAISRLIDDAWSKLAPFYQTGMTSDQSNAMLWNVMIVEFWVCIRPFGWELGQHHEQGLRDFVQKVFDFGVYLGLKQWLKDMEFKQPTAPKLPSPPPLPLAQPAPKISSVVTSVAKASQPPTPHVNKTFTFQGQPQQGPAPKPFQDPPAQVPVQKPAEKLPLPNTQYPPGPVVQQQPALSESTGGNQAPSKPAPTAPQASSSSSSIVTGQPVQEPLVGLNFDDMDMWAGLTRFQLLRLQFSSFGWDDEERARTKVWQFSSAALIEFAKHTASLRRNWKNPAFVKMKLISMAPHLKRAAAVLRLQVHAGKSSDYTSLRPILTEMKNFITTAGMMARECGGLPKNGSWKEWRNASIFFYNEVLCEEETVSNLLRKQYGARNWDELEHIWEANEPEWKLDREE